MSVKKNKKRSNGKRKPKVTLNRSKVIALSVVLVSLCIAGLIVSTVTSTPRVENINSPEVAESTIERKSEVAQDSKKAAAEADKKSESISVRSVPVEGVTKETEVKAKVREITPKETPKPEAEKKAVTSSVSDKKETQPVKSVTSPSKNEVASVNRSNSQDKDKIQEAGKKVQSPYNIPKAVNGATLVFVIDDAGLNVNNVKSYVSLPFPITVAVLPKLSHSKECADAVRSAGKEVILHQPMQASNLNISPGPGAITPDMNSYEIAATLNENIREIGPVKGLNNHEGSLITENVIKMGFILDIAYSQNLYFLDSRTSAASQASQAALERDYRIFERNAPFLDNAVNRDEMLQEIYKGLAIANKSGTAIIIGHVDKSVKILPDLLRDMYPYLVAAGYKFSVPSAL